MARDHARLLVSIWTGEDFTRLTSAQQLTYLSLISSPDLSWCGVLPFLPQRLALLSADATERKVRASLTVLEDRRFIVLDEITAEVLVRSYVRHDNLLRQPNVVKAMIKALQKVHSERLQGVVLAELNRAFHENPEAKGWPIIRSEQPELFARVTANPSSNPSGNPLRKVG